MHRQTAAQASPRRTGWCADSAQYPAPAFADLYHRRWRIEEAFKRLKHRLSLEHTSGLTWLAACQDVGAKMLC
ncbi:MAG: transposase, partial [Candidatus Dechloromonas phosphoritropha]